MVVVSWMRRGTVGLALAALLQACAGTSIEEPEAGGSGGTSATGGAGGRTGTDGTDACRMQPCDVTRCPCAQPPHGGTGGAASGGRGGAVGAGGPSAAADAPGGEGGSATAGAAGEDPGASGGTAGTPVVGTCTLQSITPDPRYPGDECNATFLCEGGRSIAVNCDGENDGTGTSLCDCAEGAKHGYVDGVVEGEAPASCYAAGELCLAALSR